MVGARVPAMLGCLAFASPAFAIDAGVLFADDFETGSLLTSDVPPGHWDVVELLPPASTLTALDAGAHRGGRGLRLDDQHSGAGAGGDGRLLGTYQAVIPAHPVVFARTWVRVAPVVAGAVTFMIIETSTGAYPIEAVAEDGKSALGGHDRTGAYQYTPGPTLIADQAWHLVELGLAGVGTTSATRTMWVDGALFAQHVGVDLSQGVINRIGIGAVHADLVFTGTVDLDDVRLSSEPPASTLGLEATGAVATGRCVPLSLTLRSSADGGPAAAPYDVVVAVSTTRGAAALYADGNCAAPSGQLTIAAGDSNAVGSLVPLSSGPLSIAATHPDFLSASVDLSATDGGTGAGGGADGGGNGGAGAGTYRVACGCQASPLDGWVLVLSVSVLARSARARKRA